jgi:hypothetical protein
MNLFFLVEGRRTESKIYPAWLSYLLPQLQRVKNYRKITQNNYYLIDGGGYPSIKERIVYYIDEINTINQSPINSNYHHFVICLDAEEITHEERKNEIETYINAHEVKLQQTQLTIIVHQRCMESWFLGNRKIFTRHPQNPDLREYINFYDVYLNDPEMTGKYIFDTHADFHYHYLKALLSEKYQKLTYTKHDPGPVLEKYYLEQLQARIITDPTHLLTFQTFINFCQSVS